MKIPDSAWIFYCLTVCFRATICLRISSITVPQLKQRGDSATFSCDYDMEGSRLYSVKWYRDGEEFYRYMPRLQPPQHSHTLDGVYVDVHKSSARRVHLRELTLKSRGLYRCEVSEEAPSFHSAQAEGFMEVYYFPREPPHINGHERRYEPEELTDINCTSARAYPAPTVQWFVDGQKAKSSWLEPYESVQSSHGLFVSVLGLKIPARSRMRLRCVTSIGSSKRERAIVIDVSRSEWAISNWTIILAAFTTVVWSSKELLIP